MRSESRDQKLFHYRGEIPASKSILNRLLVCQSYTTALHSTTLRSTTLPTTALDVKGESRCDDVLKMRQGLESLFQGKAVDCGAAGTTLRFLALRASRLPGQHRLIGTPRLLSRPQQTLVEIAAQLAVKFDVGPTQIGISSQGWMPPKGPILVDRSQSSQFLSALVLNAWELPFDLRLQMVGGDLSEGYWQMTRQLVERLGMKLKFDSVSNELLIEQGQGIDCTEIRAESDLSSAFAVAAFAALGGQVELENFPLEGSLQPDVAFVGILEQMGLKVESLKASSSSSVEPTTGLLRISQSPGSGLNGNSLKPIEVNLGNCPDLFPVLAILCSLAKGPSRLYGAPQLVHKESNRIAKVAELLEIMGRSCQPQPDGMLIEGRPPDFLASKSPVAFDPDHDHRLAFAAALAAHAGCPIEVTEPSVVNKSFPEFWEVVAEGQSQGGIP